MKNRHSLLEVGVSLFIFGFSIILFPSIFKKSETHHYETPDNIYIGIFLMIIGGFLLLIKWYNRKKNKNNIEK